MRMTALDHWRDYIKSHDHRALWDLLHPDAVFESVVHTPQRGRKARRACSCRMGSLLPIPD
jgi:ketosteroid isomerase-like protein